MVLRVPSAVCVRPVPQVMSATTTGMPTPIRPETDAVENFDRYEQPRVRGTGGKQRTDRQRKASYDEQPAAAAAVRHMPRPERHRNHHRLDDNDIDREPVRAILPGRDQALADQRQHIAVGEVKKGEGHRQSRQAAVTQDIADGRPMLDLVRFMLRPAMGAPSVEGVDRRGGNGDDRAPNAIVPKTQKGAVRPSAGPSSMMAAAAQTMPAWLKAWFKPCWAGKRFLPTMPRVNRVSAGSSSVPPAPAMHCDRITQNRPCHGTMMAVPSRMAPQAPCQQQPWPARMIPRSGPLGRSTPGQKSRSRS
jgi:hypothetical protein